MKALLLVLIFSLSFLPLAFSRHFSFSPPVVDVEGKELKLGAAYYVVSNAVVHPEGLCLVDVKNLSASCPQDVVQCTLFHKSLLGSPVIFSSDNETEDDVVRESTFYDLQFSVDDGDCGNNTAWSLADAGIPLWKYVGTYPDTPSVQFQLQKSGFGYNIVFCENIAFGSPVCFGIGFITDGLYSRLGTGLGVKSNEFFFMSNETVATY